MSMQDCSVCKHPIHVRGNCDFPDSCHSYCSCDGPKKRIVAAAIREGACIFTGAHHSSIIRYVVECAEIRPVKGEQGFLTSEGEFVGRREALEIALLSGQVKQDFSRVGGLLSEMLWLVPDVQ